MTIEATLERIAVALEKIAAGGTALSTGTVKPKEVVETASPKLTGSAGSTKTPATTTAKPAATPSAEPESEDLAETADGPSAALTEDQIAELRKNANAAVLLAVKPDKLGRDPTIAILKAHGGAKVPEVPVEQLAALTAALNEAMGL